MSLYNALASHLVIPHFSAMGTCEEVVQAQLEAYNAKDIERVLNIYAADAELFEHPATLLAKGTVALRQRFEARFRETNLHAALLKRIGMGNTVIDHEEVTRTFPEGPGKLELIMIYQVENGYIIKAWSIVGERALL